MNIQGVNIIDNFFSEQNFIGIYTASEFMKYSATHQPQCDFYETRYHGYPVHETQDWTNDSEAYIIFKNTFEEHTKTNIQYLKILFRKAYKEEVSKSPHKNRNEALIHVDTVNDVDYAGVVYLNNHTLNNGTRIYSDENKLEPNVIVGAKPNRCVFYKKDIPHSIGIDWNVKQRKTVVFFLKIEK